MYRGRCLFSNLYLFIQFKIHEPYLLDDIHGFIHVFTLFTFHTILFERWLAFFRYKGNLGYLMYMSDSVGYFGSVFVLLYKNFGTKGFTWLPFFTSTAYLIGIGITVLGTASFLYFKRKETIYQV